MKLMRGSKIRTPKGTYIVRSKWYAGFDASSYDIENMETGEVKNVDAFTMHSFIEAGKVEILPR